MSMLLMVQAMKAKVGNPLRKLVLVKLADQANDDGECWPSYQSIADACEMSRRTVISHIEWLEENGFLRRNYRKSKEGLSRSNVFVLTIDSSANAAPRSANNSPSSANAAPPGSANAALGGANAAPIETVNESTNVESVNESGARAAHATPPADAPNDESAPPCPASEPASSTVAEESSAACPAKAESENGSDGGKRFHPLQALLALGVDRQVAEDWLAFRKVRRAPLTRTALDGVIREAGKAGITVGEAVRIAAEKPWVGFKADWDWRSGGAPQGRVIDHATGTVVDTSDPYAAAKAQAARIMAKWEKEGRV